MTKRNLFVSVPVHRPLGPFGPEYRVSIYEWINDRHEHLGTFDSDNKETCRTEAKKFVAELEANDAQA